MRRLMCAAALLVGCGLVGCDGEKIKPMEIKTTEPDPVVVFRTMLENYVRGQPVTSEASTVEVLVGKIKLKDAAKGQIAEDGWKEIMKNKKNPSSAAKSLLAKLK